MKKPRHDVACLNSLRKFIDEFPGPSEEAPLRYILSSRPPSEEAQIKYTFSLNKIGHAASAPIKC